MKNLQDFKVETWEQIYAEYSLLAENWKLKIKNVLELIIRFVEGEMPSNWALIK